MQINKIENNCLGSVSTLSKYYSLLNEEHGTTFMLSRTGNKRQFMSPACYSTVCSPQCFEIFLVGTCLYSCQYLLGGVHKQHLQNLSFFDHLPSSVYIFYGIKVYKRLIFLTTFPPSLVNVVCERPLNLIIIFNRWYFWNWCILSTK